MNLLTKRNMIAVVALLGGFWVHGAQEAPMGMPVEQQWKGFNAKQEKSKRLVIRDQKTWVATWDVMKGNVMPKPAVPAIDFDKQMVVAVFMGRKMSGGYGIKIVKVKEKDGLIVTVKESSPPKDAMVTMALTSPYHVVVIPKSDKKVEFVNEKIPADKPKVKK